jgi:hypothetical protein
MQRLCQWRKSLCDGLPVTPLCSVLPRARRFAPECDPMKVCLEAAKWTFIPGGLKGGNRVGKPVKRETGPDIGIHSEKCRTTILR